MFRVKGLEGEGIVYQFYFETFVNYILDIVECGCVNKGVCWQIVVIDEYMNFKLDDVEGIFKIKLRR